MYGNSNSDVNNEIVKSTDSNSTNNNTNNDIAFSKKAQHQCDADENLFLRFLELDPPSPPIVTVDTTQQQQQQQQQPQKVSPVPPINPKGRTPFTITKKLMKLPESSFGFSIVWTHPPRIEKIESDSSAEKVGMLQGDYVIFIDKYNVVTMPELDILNLIRMQGNALTLEIFRRPSRHGSTRSKVFSPKLLPPSRISTQELSTDEENSIKPAMKSSSANMSSMSLENTKRRLRLPQVAPANSRKEALPVTMAVTQLNPESLRKRHLIQLVNREQHFLSAINFGLERFVHPLRDRRDLISMNDHRTLFQNIDELVQLSEDILEQILQNEHDPQMHFVSRVYLSKSMALSAAYKKYCSGIKRSDCVLVNKSRTCNSEFLNFLNEPLIPKKRPDITTFIHRPLQHFRDILKLIQLISSNCPSDSEEYKNFSSVINELQAAYREITVGGGLMEPLGEGRPLLSLQDLESRLVFTKCKPFTLSIPGRQWVFGGDLSRIDGRSVKQFWTLLFSDIILFAKVSRDRVLFITDEPLPLSNIVDCVFNVKKKANEFRLVIDPQGQTAKSPNVNCAPDLSRTPLKSVKKRTIVLRAPSIELKAVWQNLLTRQIYFVNTILGSSLNSPLESPDVLVSNLNLHDMNLQRAQSMASSKMCSLESFNMQQQQLRRNDQQQTQHPQNQQQQQHKDENSNNKEVNKCNLPSSSSQTVVDGENPKPKINRALEELIDEKCSMLSKKGVSKEGSVHLAQWMKGQFNKNSIPEFEEDEKSKDWSVEEVVKRSKELQLMHEIKKIDDSEDEQQSQQSHQSTSKSTTSGSQITVRSSPINNNNSRSDSISICRQCHKFCSKKKMKNSISNDSNNNQLNKHAKQDSSCESSSTLKDITEDTSTEEIKEMRASQTMTTLQNKSPINESPLKTSTSSPSALQSAAKETKSVRIKLTSSPKAKMSNGVCNCECKPKDFEKTTLSPDEVKHEIVKILTEVEQTPSKVSITDSSSRSSDSPYMSYSSIRARTLQSKYSFLYDNNHMTAASKNQPLNIIKETMIGAQSSTANETTSIIEQELKTASSTLTTSVTTTQVKTSLASSSTKEGGNDDNNSFSLMLAQSIPITSSVPAISILPPTPDLKKQHSFNATTNNLEITKVNSISIKTESSFDSIDDEEEEPPYVKLKTSLRKYGTMSSLERLPSEDTDDKTLDSSGDESADDEMKINSGDTSQSYKTWTSRAGSFLEESKAFIDKYLGRNDGSGEYVYLKSNSKDGNDFDEYETIEGETSGTSGEEVWGTPTSGGENDEMHMFNGDGNQTSPKSSSGDEDTEIMMDELLMAPMMTTASSIRGLLPRRRLEPLFEEDTDSCDSNNENSLLNNKEGEGVEKSIEKFPSSRPSSVDSDQATPSIDEEMMMNLEEMMSPTTRLAQQDVMSPLEDLDLDEMDVGMMSEGEETLKTTTPVENFGRDADKSGVSALFSRIERRGFQNHIGSAEATIMDEQPIAAEVVRQTQSLRTIEMRLAMNNDIMGDEDLLNYPNLTSILGRDLSLYHRVSGRDIIMNRIMDHPKDTSLHRQTNACSSQDQRRNDPPSSFSQQKNSKMDTPIPKRKVKQRIWSSSGYAQREEKTALSDLEKLARREKIYCMTQQRENQQNSDSDSVSSQVTASNKSNKLFKILRRNSENMMGKKLAKENRNSYSSGEETSSSGQTVMNSDNDKAISLDRRFFKQLTKRRSNSLSDFSST